MRDSVQRQHGHREPGAQQGINMIGRFLGIFIKTTKEVWWTCYMWWPTTIKS